MGHVWCGAYGEPVVKGLFHAWAVFLEVIKGWGLLAGWRVVLLDVGRRTVDVFRERVLDVDSKNLPVGSVVLDCS